MKDDGIPFGVRGARRGRAWRTVDLCETLASTIRLTRPARLAGRNWAPGARAGAAVRPVRCEAREGSRGTTEETLNVIVDRGGEASAYTAVEAQQPLHPGRTQSCVGHLRRGLLLRQRLVADVGTGRLREVPGNVVVV